MPREEQPAAGTDEDISDTLGGMPLRAEEIGYAADELAKCPKCSRANSPERFECIYCGAVLGIGDNSSTIDRTAPEAWENGFNLILMSAEGDENSVGSAAKILGLAPQVVADAIAAKRPLPLIRVKDRASAEVLSELLSGHSFDTKIVEDADVRLAQSVRRIRGIEFGDGGGVVFADFNTLEKVAVNYTDIDLIVSGKLFSTRVESTEKMARRKPSKVVEQAELSTDTGVADIYVSGGDSGLRIISTGFDFSCLGSQKTMFAAENMPAVVDAIRSRAANARFVGDYDRSRMVLDVVWPVAKRRDSKGMRRSIFKGSSVESVMTSDNLDQFTRFSRLSRILL